MNDELLAAFDLADRLAAAARARLLRQTSPRTPRASLLRGGLVRTGHLLVTVGRRLECLGGDCLGSRPVDANQPIRV